MEIFRKSGGLFNKGQFLILYEPFKICNKNTGESNYFFSLKMQNDLWGIQNLEEVFMRLGKWFFSRGYY